MTDDKPYFIDGIDLDRSNEEFNIALDLAMNTHYSMYITGRAGTGKSTFLKYLDKIAGKNIVKLAPTGVAAINAGGQTLHSFFKIRPSVYTPDDPRLKSRKEQTEEGPNISDYFHYNLKRLKMIRGIETIVIDEISMVRCDTLDVIDKLLRFYRMKPEPFGGVQMIFIGDVFQLAPVAKDEEWEILREYYDSEFFFDAKVMKYIKLAKIELQKIYRQKDSQFIDLLNKVRLNRLEEEDYILLNSKVNRSLIPTAIDDNYIVLTTTNAKAASINETRLQQLTTPLITYKADVTGEFNENDMPTDAELSLRVGSQVIFVKNDHTGRYYNGQIGTIVDLENDIIHVSVLNKNGDKITIDIERELWHNVKYAKAGKQIKEHVLGTFTQFPVKLAWAITVHKSQGLTFDKVVADIGRSFAPGQVYVALSRCTSLEGLILMNPIYSNAILSDRRVVEHAANNYDTELIMAVREIEKKNPMWQEEDDIRRLPYYLSEKFGSFENYEIDLSIYSDN